MDPQSPSPEERRAALAALLRKKAARRTWPLSLAQQRVWYAQQLAPDTPFFNLAIAVRLDGALDPAVLAQCLSEIVHRHEALRTVFSIEEDQPVQSIAAPRPLPLPLVDLSSVPDTRERETRRLASAGVQAPIGLSDGLLVRATLVRLEAAEHVLLLNLHHIAADGWSLGILANELAALYPAFADSRSSPLPELPLQYKDYAVWQRRRAEEESERHLVHWKQRLAEAPEIELPTDRPRPRSRTFRGASEHLSVPAPVTEKLLNLAHDAGASLAMASLAAFEVLLARYSGQEDGMIGLSVAHRDRPEIAGLIGQLSNLIAVRTHLDGGLGFQALLARVREGLLADLAHQDLSFDRLVAELRPRRDPSRHPLVPVMFGFRSVPKARRTSDAPGFELVEFETGLARFDLELTLWEEGGGVRGALLYHLDLFHPTTARRLARQYEALLAAAVHDPERPALELPLLSESERHQLVVEWNDTAVPDLDPKTGPGWSVLDWIASATSRDPGAPAVEHRGETLSFGELDQRVNRLAHHLLALGAGPGRHVGLLLDRSLHWPVAVLACLRAGAAFVPLDPRHPRERLETTAADAGLDLVLVANGRPELEGVRRLDLDAEADDIACQPGERPAWEPSPEDAAYLVYTSGSTGTPKGVVAVHRNLGGNMTLAGWLGIGPGDAYLHTASLGFAASVRQLLSPLSRGARVVLAGADDIADPAALLALARERRVTVLDLVASYWQSLGEVLDRLTPEARAALLDGGPRLLLAASEPLPTAVPRRWAGLLPGARFVHLLGHSETSSINAVHPVPATLQEDPGSGAALVPLGRPTPGRRLLLLDDRLQPVPLGAVGEICVAGGATRGYWRRPERTAESFVPDPVSRSAGARLYRTGDLGRLLPDGTLVFAGRRDRQVKVRGQRVEVAEIEAALVRLPGVGRAVVEPRSVRRARAEAEVELVAYLTPGPGGPPDPAELRRRLSERLPPSMIPAAFVVLATLPLTPTGKLDRGALPMLPLPDLTGEDGEHSPPRTAIEARMAELWAEVLGRPRVGAADGFFELGGHSLLAVLLLARIREAFGIEIGLRAFLVDATVAASSGAVEEALVAAAAAADPGELARLAAEIEALSEDEVLAGLAAF
jgi:amino acid adenylation domain-containing protein